MARRYVRDKIGRFSSKGGGGKRAGKQSKSTAGRGARAAYHDAKSGLRFEKRIKSEFGGKAKTGSNVTKAKRKLTTLSNQMTGKGKAAGSGIKKGLRSQTASRRKQSFRSKATKGRTARAEYKAARRADRKTGGDSAKKRVIKKQTGKPAYQTSDLGRLSRDKAPRAGSKTKAQKIRAKIDLKKSYNKMERGSEFKGKKKGTAKQAAAGKKRSAKAKVTKAAARKASFKGKATEGRAAKAKYKSATSKVRKTERDFKSASRSDAVLSKKASRANWTQKATDKAVIAGVKREKAYKSKTAAKGQLTRVTNKMTNKGAAKAKISEKKQRAQDKAAALGRAKPRVRKLAAGRKKAAATRAKTAAKKAAAKAKKVATKKKATTKAPSSFGKTAKYTRQGKLSKASKGSGAKQKYKKATSELRKSKRGQSLYQQSQMGHPSKRKQGQVTRLTNKFTNKRKATGSLKDLEKKIPKKTKRSGSNKIVGFKRKKR